MRHKNKHFLLCVLIVLVYQKSSLCQMFVLLFFMREWFWLHPRTFYFQRSSVPDSRGSTPCGCYEQGKIVHSPQATTFFRSSRLKFERISLRYCWLIELSSLITVLLVTTYILILQLCFILNKKKCTLYFRISWMCPVWK